MLKENKICFIICSNDERYLRECLYYINRLEIPEGYEIDVISVWEAKSMTSGYNEGMQATDAKYKIYLHQDVFIVYRKFLYSLLKIFKSDCSIGMIGMVGAPKISVSGVMWFGHREGQLYGYNRLEREYDSYEYQLADGLHEVDAVDGLLIATSTDIPWREDKFDGWDFYDVSQSLEFKKANYKVVVPEQLCPWCKHDDGVVNLINYNKYRKKCMEEYTESFYPERFLISKRGNSEKCLAVVIISRNQFEQTRKCLESIKRFSDIEDSQIVVVDNGSEDGLRHWIKEQNYNYIICGEMRESYSVILNEVVEKFITMQDMLIINGELSFLPSCVDALVDGLKADKNIGAVFARKILEDSKQAKHYENVINTINDYIAKNEVGKRREVTGLPAEAVLISNKLLKELDGFDERFETAENAILDFAYQGKIKGYRYYELENSFFYKREKNARNILEQIDGEKDKQILKEKWKISNKK